MNVKGKLFYFVKIVVYFLIAVLFYLMFMNFFTSFYKNNDVTVNFFAEDMGTDPVEIYYMQNGQKDYSADRMETIPVGDGKNFNNNGDVDLPPDINLLRVDFGSKVGAEIAIKSIVYRNYSGMVTYTPEQISKMYFNQVEIVSCSDDEIVIRNMGNDPYLIIEDVQVQPYKEHNQLWSILCALIGMVLFSRFIKLKSIVAIANDLLSNRKLIMSLAKNDFKTKYAGSYFGIIWAFIQPVCTIIVFWFVFQIGFRNADVGNVKYILWFATGLIPWFFFQDGWNSATYAFMDYSYLVKKVKFKVNILPVIKIISAFFVHIFFVIFMFFFYGCYKELPTIYAIQIIYYSFCMVVLVTALSFITAPLIVFFKDLGQVMNIVLQFGMWLTPIMWSIDNLPVNLKWLIKYFKFNPMYYIVQGYRDSMIYHVWFYNNIKQTMYFWIVTILLLIVGAVIYRKLKPHFADVL